MQVLAGMLQMDPALHCSALSTILFIKSRSKMQNSYAVLTVGDLVCGQAEWGAEACRAAAADWHAAPGPVKTLDCAAL